MFVDLELYIQHNGQVKKWVKLGDFIPNNVRVLDRGVKQCEFNGGIGPTLGWINKHRGERTFHELIQLGQHLSQYSNSVPNRLNSTPPSIIKNKSCIISTPPENRRELILHAINAARQAGNVNLTLSSITVQKIDLTITRVAHSFLKIKNDKELKRFLIPSFEPPKKKYHSCVNMS